MMQPLAGRHVVVTGGSGALGVVVVQRLVAAGASCHVPSRADAAAGGAPRGVHMVGGIDLSCEGEVDAFYDGLPALWGSVHLAGGFAMAPLAQEGEAGFRRLMDMNALTVLLCSRAAARRMRRAGGGGRIVNVSARPGLEPRRGAGMAAYAASKAAVASLTLALAEELKEERILVNAIAPSTLDTPANRRAMPGADASRWLSPGAAAEAILQLLLPANGAVSGAVLPLYALA